MKQLKAIAKEKIEHQKIANDVENAIKTWMESKSKWYKKEIIKSSFLPPHDQDSFVDGIVVIREGDGILISMIYQSGRMRSQFYRMLSPSFRKWVNDKVRRAIKRKYGLEATFYDLHNSSWNPELVTDINPELLNQIKATKIINHFN